MRFLVEEFYLILGLKYTGNDDLIQYRMESRLKEQYFENHQNIYTKEVQEMFVNLPAHTVYKDDVKKRRKPCRKSWKNHHWLLKIVFMLLGQQKQFQHLSSSNIIHSDDSL